MFRHSRIVPPYYEHPAYLDAVEASIRDDLGEIAVGAGTLCHQLPRAAARLREQGRPLPHACRSHDRRTCEAHSVGLVRSGRRRINALGRKEWLKPYTDDVLADLARKGRETRVCRAPGFHVGLFGNVGRNRQRKPRKFSSTPAAKHLKNGTCLNDHPKWIEAMARIIQEEGTGWL